MWEDDRHWLPEALAGRSFEGRFVFEGERIVWKEVVFDMRVREEQDGR